MGTSRSSKRETRWVAGVRLFSGRPDPAWTVPSRIAKRLIERWESLPPFSGTPPSPAALGYRGSFLRDGGGRQWLAFGGVVTLESKNKTESREDTGGVWEKLLLATAPKGTLPRSFLKND
jgi:hypothetical protein